MSVKCPWSSGRGLPGGHVGNDSAPHRVGLLVLALGLCAHAAAAAAPACAPPRALRPTLQLRGGSADSGASADSGGGGALGEWAEVAAAVEEMKRELRVTVDTAEMPAGLARRLWACRHLQVLVVTGGALERIPPGIEALGELTTLIVSGNKLAALPPELAQLPKLRVLEAEDNALAALPHSASVSWPALEVVNVARNKLSSLAPLASAAHLLTVKADGNELRDAGAVELVGWVRLKTLTLSNNGMLELPLGVGQLAHLEALDVRNNCLTQLPIGGLKEKTLKLLAFDGNPLEDLNRLTKIMAKGVLAPQPARVEAVILLETWEPRTALRRFSNARSDAAACPTACLTACPTAGPTACPTACPAHARYPKP